MGDRFRSMIESEFAEVDTPPIGDLVDNAIRDGRRLRRTRLVQRSVACAAAVGVLALGLGMATATLSADGAPDGGGSAAGQGLRSTVPASPSPARPAGTVPPDAPTMAIFESAPRPLGAAAQAPPAAPAVILMALRSVLPPGVTAAYAGGVFDQYTGVQVYLDRGSGYGMIRVAVARYGQPPTCDDGPPGVVLDCRKDAGVWVQNYEIESNCVQRRGVTVYRPDGIAVQVNIGSCIVEGAWSAPPGIDSVDEKVLDVSEAVQIGADPIWSKRSLAELDEQAHASHPTLPMLTAFNGVGA